MTDEMIDAKLCESYRVGFDNRLRHVEIENQRAEKQSKEIHGRINVMKDNAAQSVENIVENVTKKAEAIHLDLSSRFKNVAGGVSMKLFLWVSGFLVSGLCASVGYLYAMNGSMGEYRSAINSSVNSLTTDTKLIQKDMEYTREAIDKIEKTLNRNEDMSHR